MAGQLPPYDLANPEPCPDCGHGRHSLPCKSCHDGWSNFVQRPAAKALTWTVPPDLAKQLCDEAAAKLATTNREPRPDRAPEPSTEAAGDLTPSIPGHEEWCPKCRSAGTELCGRCRMYEFYGLRPAVEAPRENLKPAAPASRRYARARGRRLLTTSRGSR